MKKERKRRPGFFLADLLLGMSLALVGLGLLLPCLGLGRSWLFQGQMLLAERALAGALTSLQQRTQYLHHYDIRFRCTPDGEKFYAAAGTRRKTLLDFPRLGLQGIVLSGAGGGFTPGGNVEAPLTLTLRHVSRPGLEQTLTFEPVTGRMSYGTP